MSLTYSSHVPDTLRARFEETNACKAMRANQSDLQDSRTWVVEYAREHGGRLDVWLFAYSDPEILKPEKHIHVTVDPDRGESTVNLHFLIGGPDRVKARHNRHGVKSPN